jgi:hypothetical protein
MTDRGDERERGSFFFWLIVAAAAFYLLARAIQGVAWVVERF